MSPASTLADIAAEPCTVRGVLADVSGLVRGDEALLVLTLKQWCIAERAPCDDELHVYASCPSSDALSERMQNMPDLGAVLSITVQRDPARDVLGRAPSASELWLCGDAADLA